MAFFAALALLFIASAWATIAGCTSMSAAGGMPMPGGWTMSMAWMRMPGQTWLGTARSFTGMWLGMMIAMMLPSLVPLLLRHRQFVTGRGEDHPGRLSARLGAGYFLVWAACGLALFPLGASLAAAEMRQPVLGRIAPLAAAVVVLLAGALQFTGWKAHHLMNYREALVSCCSSRSDPGTAFRQGLRLGLRCCYCCANLTAILLVTGVMDLYAMAGVTAAITLERLAPAGERAARVVGVVIVGAGLFLGARAVVLG